ncbi:MAG: dTDP-4-dehydrorhamnose 3,5-epimerase [Burkholderiales bacterium]|nr:dTDP-4-dehydrorhamnose 3,5-epimerase [Burkholderiales bacterium]
MRAVATAIADVLVIEPEVYADERGYFFESFNQRAFAQATGIAAKFVQDNHSRSVRNTVRGLHYQIQQSQGKLVRAVSGEVFDVVVDLRRGSPTFGKSISHHLSAENKSMLWIPPGFAHGFAVISEYADFLYKTTDYWAPQHERTLLWNDPELAIAWPLAGEPILAPKDRMGTRLSEAEVFD